MYITYAITLALNLILCYYAISDSEKMKKCFHRMLQINSNIDEDRYYPTVVSVLPDSCCIMYEYNVNM